MLYIWEEEKRSTGIVQHYEYLYELIIYARSFKYRPIQSFRKFTIHRE